MEQLFLSAYILPYLTVY